MCNWPSTCLSIIIFTHALHTTITTHYQPGLASCHNHVPSPFILDPNIFERHAKTFLTLISTVPAANYLFNY